jgi:hypothetical protein
MLVKRKILKFAEVAQLVEHSLEARRVSSSSLLLSTKIYKKLRQEFFIYFCAEEQARKKRSMFCSKLLCRFVGKSFRAKQRLSG